MLSEELERYEEDKPSNFGVFSNNFEIIYEALMDLSEKPYLKASHIRERSGLDSGRVSPIINTLTSIGILEKWNEAENSPAVYRNTYVRDDLDTVRSYLSE